MVIRLSDAQLEQARGFVKAYLATLDPDRTLLLDRYEFVDAALKVVGVGSVGTRCFVALLAGKADLDPLSSRSKRPRLPYWRPTSAGLGIGIKARGSSLASGSCKRRAMRSWVGHAPTDSIPTSASCVT